MWVNIQKMSWCLQETLDTVCKGHTYGHKYGFSRLIIFPLTINMVYNWKLFTFTYNFSSFQLMPVNRIKLMKRLKYIRSYFFFWKTDFLCMNQLLRFLQIQRSWIYVTTLHLVNTIKNVFLKISQRWLRTIIVIWSIKASYSNSHYITDKSNFYANCHSS